MPNFEDRIFKDKNLSDILGEIYENQVEKKDQISSLISELKPLISDIGDATLIVPLIKEYLDMGIKNNEQLIKMANIVQRLIQGDGGHDGVELTQEEKDQLLKEINKEFPQLKDKNA